MARAPCRAVGPLGYPDAAAAQARAAWTYGMLAEHDELRA
jgi:hypothetical protein